MNSNTTLVSINPYILSTAGKDKRIQIQLLFLLIGTRILEMCGRYGNSNTTIVSINQCSKCP